jgi:hypothetical protein
MRTSKAKPPSSSLIYFGVGLSTVTLVVIAYFRDIGHCWASGRHRQPHHRVGYEEAGTATLSVGRRQWHPS